MNFAAAQLLDVRYKKECMNFSLQILQSVIADFQWRRSAYEREGD